MSTEESLTLAVLAGGEGSRAGGPKSFFSLTNEPVLTRLLRRLDWAGPTLLVTGPLNQNPPGAELFDREVSDEIARVGPAQGLLTALRACETERLILIPVDMPLLSKAVLLELAKAQADGVMCLRESDGEQIVEPFPSIFNRSIAAQVETLLAQNRRSLHGLLQLPGFTTIDVNHWPAVTWTNLNTAEEWSAFERTHHEL